MKKLLLAIAFVATTFSYGQTILDFEPGKTYNLGNNKGSTPFHAAATAANPVTDGINASATALSITKESGAPNWAFPIINQIGSDPGGWNFTGGKVMQLKVLSVNNTSFTLTFRPWVSGAFQELTQTFTGVTLNEWFVVEFDYSAVGDGWANRIDVWFNKDGGTADGDVFYIDDISQSTTPTLSTRNIINAKLDVYPNPTNGVVHISDVDGIDSVTISNINGQVLKTFSGQNSIDISDLVPGVYVLQADNGLIRKIIKQ